LKHTLLLTILLGKKIGNNTNITYSDNIIYSIARLHVEYYVQFWDPSIKTETEILE